MSWLKVEVKGFSMVSLILICVLLRIVWEGIMLLYFNPLGVTIIVSSRGTPLMVLIPYFLGTLLIRAVLEEWVFRLLPFAICIGSYGRRSGRAIMAVSVVSSIIFGWVHGGPQFIPFEGVGGLIYCIVFIKCGGFQERYAKATACSTVTHYSFNLFVIVLSCLLKGKGNL